MPIDPSTGFPTTSEDRRADKLAELERRLAALERGGPAGIVTLGAGPPAASLTTPFYIDTTNHKAYGRDAAGYFILN